MLQAILAAAEELGSPVLLQTTPSTLKYMTLRQAYAMAKAEADAVRVPVALHLDHCESYEGVCDALDAGYSSVMIDASKLDFEENIAVTRKTVQAAHARGVTVEAELGTVGGKEDSHSASIAYTDPGEAVDFFRRTGVDIFAVAIGTAHGFYQGEPRLDFELLQKLAGLIDAPLVLHGGSGIPDEMIRKTIELGICKVNFATELRAAMTAAVRQALKDESIIDPKKFMAPGREAVKSLCMHKIRLCGSDHKA